IENLLHFIAAIAHERIGHCIFICTDQVRIFGDEFFGELTISANHFYIYLVCHNRAKSATNHHTNSNTYGAEPDTSNRSAGSTATKSSAYICSLSSSSLYLIIGDTDVVYGNTCR